MTALASVAALTIAALFTGAAFYVNAVEHPARMTLDASAALRQWAPSYHRGYAMQATLALAGAAAGAASWWISGNPLSLAGAVLMFANWPWTLIVIMPVNRRLKEMANSGTPGAELLNRWAALHSVRTGLGAAATICFAAALS